MAKRKYKKYSTLKSRLRRSGVEKYSAVATLLLDYFVGDGSTKMDQQELVKRKIISRDYKDFKEWRRRMEDLEFFAPWVSSKKIEPGANLVEIINRERFAVSEMVTKEVFDQKVGEQQKSIEELREEVRACTAALASMIEDYDPPVTPEKLRLRLQIIEGGMAAHLKKAGAGDEIDDIVGL